ncbi:MAG: SPOR domain-containing protein [Desulfobacteraceae bacterium]|nr:SPOR domain-containing protein [Desulfobacteraceae bacterium]
MAQYDINLREYWRILKKRKFMVIFTAIVLGVFSTSLAIMQAPTHLYTSICSIKFEKQTTIEGLYAKTISWSTGDDLVTQISIIKSYSVLQEVAKRLGLIPKRTIMENDRLKSNMVDIIVNLQSKFHISRESYTNILDIGVTDTDPIFAQRLANTTALTYKELHAEELSKRTREAIKYIDEELKKTRRNLRKAEEEFNMFSQEKQLLSIDLQSESLLARTREIKDEIRKLREDKRGLENLLVRVEHFIKDPSGSDRNLYSTKASQQYKNTNNTFVALLLKKDTLLEGYTPQHPEMIVINHKIMGNARTMAILLKLQIRDMGKKEIDLKNELGIVNNTTNVLMENKLEYGRLKRKVKSFYEMTALLEQKNQEALIRKSEKPEEVTIVRPALLPTRPINPPNTATTGTMGVIIGLVVGLVIAFIVETFDTSLGAIEDVEETLGTQVLGVIPLADLKEIQESVKNRYPGGLGEDATKVVNLISHFSPKTIMAENFRSLRTNIQFKMEENEIKVISITSTSPQEGKTLVSINLGLSLAQAGMKTLLVCADLRKPMVGAIFGIETIPGLTDVLLGNYPWRDTVRTITDIIMGKMTMDEVMMTPGLDNLNIITAGTIPPNPAELIESKRLSSFIEEAKQGYDIVIFDSPPILSAADAAILGTKVDGVLLVYRVGVISRGLLKRSSTQLEQVNCNIIGVTLNRMRPEISPDFQDFKYYKYYYHSDKKEQTKGDRVVEKAISFLRRKGDRHTTEDRDVLPGSAGKESQDTEGKKPKILRWVLIFVAITFLTVGILWQNGIIDPAQFLGSSKPVKKDDIKPIVVKKPKSVSIQKPLPDKDSKPVKKDDIKPTVVKKPKSVSIQKPRPPQPQPRKEGDTNKKMVKSNEKIPSYPYSLMLSSFRTPEKAKKAISIYNEKGLSPYLVRVEFKKMGVWYRVYTGYFLKYKQAKQFQQEHKLHGAVIKKTAYANLVGIDLSSEELYKKIMSMKKLGYSPYVIEDQGGKTRLFLGAFLTREEAERQFNELQSHNIQNQAVSR